VVPVIADVRCIERSMEVETLLALIAILVALILVVEIYRAFADHNLVVAAKGVLDTLEKRTQEDAQRKRNQHDDIADLIGAEKLEDALSLIHLRQQDRPNDARLYWFKGRVLFLKGDKSSSKGAFQRSKELEPSYSDNVKPYLDQAD